MFLADMSMFCGDNIVKAPGPASCTDILGPNDCSGDTVQDPDMAKVLDSERLVVAPLLSDDSFVRHLRVDPIVVECERVGRNGLRNAFSAAPNGKVEHEALALPPSELVAELPPDHKPGDVVIAHGPHGPLEIKPHPDEKPGQTLRYSLKPAPEFEIEVPPGSKPGVPLRFARDDGAVICVSVPPQLKPGSTFTVAPPVLMVRVPEQATSGDYVVFRSKETEWWRAKVPEDLKFGKFFAARMPDPMMSYFEG